MAHPQPAQRLGGRRADLSGRRAAGHRHRHLHGGRARFRRAVRADADLLPARLPGRRQTSSPSRCSTMCARAFCWRVAATERGRPNRCPGFRRNGDGRRLSPVRGRRRLGGRSRARDVVVSSQSSILPPSLSLAQTGQKAEPLKPAPARFDAAGLAITQHHAVSVDGARIPYFQIGRADLPFDGSNACLLGGYGGFQIASLPYYSLGVGKQWLERGGVLRDRQHPRRRRVRAATGTRPACAKARSSRMTISPRWRGDLDRARRHAAGAAGLRRAAATAACWSATC